jgi:hypothetical protein
MDKENQETPKKKVAILFFGLTRSLKDIYSSLEENLFTVLKNNNFDYDNFVHTYSLPNPYTDPITKNTTYDYDNESYKILNPKHYIIEEQIAVAKKLNIGQYFTHVSNWEGCAPTYRKGCYFIRNMVLALYSKKRLVDLFSQYKNDYDYVIITRPDQAFNNKFNVNSFLLLNDSNIIIPKEHSYTGINDRICIAKPNNAIIYGNAFGPLLAYSKKKAIVSEAYWKWYIIHVCKLKIIYGSILATLVRM